MVPLRDIFPENAPENETLLLLRQTKSASDAMFVWRIDLTLHARDEDLTFELPRLTRLWRQTVNGQMRFLVERLGMPLDRLFPAEVRWESGEFTIQEPDGTEESVEFDLCSLDFIEDHEARGWDRNAAQPKAFWLTLD